MRNVTNYELRRNNILNATIDLFIQTGQPVSSERLSSQFNLSPATIRNVLSELEEKGYLIHPHTSAGRIPTQKAYRYYVNSLMTQQELARHQKEIVQRQYNQLKRELEDVLEKTSKIISDLTHYTSVVSFPGEEEKIYYYGTSFIFEHPDFCKNLNNIRHLLAALEERAKILEILNRDLEEDVKIYIGTEIGYDEISDCALIASTYRIKNRPSGRIAILGPKRMNYPKVISTLDYISEMMGDLLSGL